MAQPKIPDESAFNNFSLDQALLHFDTPRDPIFGQPISQIAISHHAQRGQDDDGYPPVNFQCGIEPLLVLGLVYYHPGLALSQVHDQAVQRGLVEDINHTATCLQELRDASLIKGNPFEGFRVWAAPVCRYSAYRIP